MVTITSIQQHVQAAGLPPVDGVAVELTDRERRAVADALTHERRRMAADVHDLIMQDLAFALASARGLAAGPTPAPQARAVVDAGERALAAARRLVGAMAEHDREPVVEAVRTSVRIAARHTRLSFDASGTPAGAKPDGPTLEALVHIGREAVTNAVKHTTPGVVEVVLERDDEWRLTVRDDGGGFEAGAVGGFGLQSMTRHADALRGSLQVTSILGVGTTVRATLP